MQYSIEDGRKLTDFLSRMDQTLLKARVALDNPQGRDIVAAYLGYEDLKLVKDADIQFVRENIDSLMDVHESISRFNTLGQLREDTLLRSAGGAGMDFQREYKSEQVMNNFKDKMGVEGRGEAIFKFQENSELRKEILLVNPDTQAMLIMELGDQIPGAKTVNGAFKIPDSVKNYRKKMLKEKLLEAEDAKYGPRERDNTNVYETRVR